MSLSGSCCSKKRKRRRKTWNETKTTIWESEDWTYFLSYFQCFNRKTEIRPELIVFKWICHVFETCGWSFDVSEGFWRIDDGLEGLRRGRSLVAATPEVFDVPLLRRPRAMRERHGRDSRECSRSSQQVSRQINPCFSTDLGKHEGSKRFLTLPYLGLAQVQKAGQSFSNRLSAWPFEGPEVIGSFLTNPICCYPHSFNLLASLWSLFSLLELN